jgi:hypothetical protein
MVTRGSLPRPGFLDLSNGHPQPRDRYRAGFKPLESAAEGSTEHSARTEEATLREHALAGPAPGDMGQHNAPSRAGAQEPHGLG